MNRDHLVSRPNELQERWIQYSQRLASVAISILGEADKLTVNSDVRDPKVLALTLLCRTLLNFKGALLMVQNGMTVEARTLTRCCFENLLWIGELAARGEEFVQEMARDEAAAQQSRGKMILSLNDALEDKLHAPLKARMDQLKEIYPKSKPIKFSELGKMNGIADSYLWFKLLSGDSAHPSMTSLARHLTRERDGSIMITVVPDAIPKDMNDTLQFANQALLGACVSTCEIVRARKTHAMLNTYFDEFLALAQLQK